MEGDLRRDLAAACRLFHKFGWDEYLLPSQHVSLRLPSSDALHIAFLVNPPGIAWNDVTPSQLDIVDVYLTDTSFTTDYTHASNVAFHIESHVEQARNAASISVTCILQCQTIAGAAITSSICGLLPICQASYFALEGGAITWRGEDPNPLNLHHKVILSPIHGLVTGGRTIAEAFHYLFYLTQACSMQTAASAARLSNLHFPAQRVDEIFASTMTPFQSKGMGHDLFVALKRSVE